MKSKILTFVIGVLVGAIVATGGFLIYQNVSGNNKNNMNNFKGERQFKNFDENMQKPNDMQNSENGEMTTPPDLPTDMQQGDQMTPPDMPSDNTQSSTDNNAKQNNSNKKSKTDSNSTTSNTI